MFFVSDLPPLEQERISCSIIAAVKYELPANIVLAVAGQEGGKPGQWVKNKNGSYDVGTMQFNTNYLTDLAKYGISATDVEKPGCYPFELAAWRIRNHVRNDKGDLWTRVANYHSRTPEYNQVYRALIMRRAASWADWLDERFNTHAVAQASVMKLSQPVTTQTIQAKAADTPRVEVRATLTTPTKPSQPLYISRQILVNN